MTALPIVLITEALIDPYMPKEYSYLILGLFLIWLLRPYPTGKYRIDKESLNANPNIIDWNKILNEKIPSTGDSYLVIGVGFLGEKLIHTLLLRGETKITMFDMNPKVGELWKNDSRVKFIRGDVTKIDDLKKAMIGIDTVFSIFAIIKWYEKLPHQRYISEKINVNGTQNVIDACLECGVKKLIQTSSSAVVQGMGRNNYINMNEETPYTTENDCPHWYALTKAIAEQLVLKANGKKGKNGQILLTSCARPCASIFGAKDNILLQLVIDRSILPVPPNGGRQSLNFIFVDNVVYGHLLVEKGLINDDKRVKGKPFCIPPEKMMRVCDFMALSCQFKKKYLGQDVTILWMFPYQLLIILSYMVDIYHSIQQYHKLSGDIEMLTPAAMVHLDKDYSYSYQKAKEVIGYEPLWTIEQGLAKSFLECKEKQLLPPLPSYKSKGN